MKPFILLQTRSEDIISDSEYQTFCRFSGLQPDQLVRIRLDQGAMPDINLDDYSGVMVGGSPANVGDPEDIKPPLQKRFEAELYDLLGNIVPRDFPFFGACYGIGILVNYLGGVISQDYGETFSAVMISLNEEGRNDPLCQGLPAAFEAFVGHHDACKIVPEGATVLASSPTCPVQLLRVKQNVYATQFHPELDKEAIIMRLHAYKYNGYFKPEDADAIEASLRGASVTEPEHLLANFVKLYAQPV